MEDWQKRVINEKEELDEKLSKLSEFLDSDEFYEMEGPEVRLLWNQVELMEKYSDILAARIYYFNKGE